MALGASLPHTHHWVTLGRSLPFCALLSSPVNRDDGVPFLGRLHELVHGVLSIVPGPGWDHNSVLILHSWKQGLWHPQALPHSVERCCITALLKIRE